MKKFLSLLLAVMLLASCIPAFADATWTISESGALKVNSDVKLSGEVVIPETVDGVTVTSLDGFAFNNQTDVTSIVMPDTIQSMSGGAINFLDGVTSLKLSENLTVIDDMNGILKGLTELTIPASVRYIGDAFTSMKAMQTLTFEGVCPVFNSQDPLHGISSSAVIYVPDDQMDAYKAALAGGYDIDELVQPSGKNAVVHSNPAAESDFVFDAATGTITGYTGVAAFLEIPAVIGGTPVKAIGEKAFYDNAAIFYVIIPEGIESIGNSAFNYCDSLTVVEFPTSLKKIGDNAFDGCYLDYVGWAEGLEEIGANAFARLAIRDVRLPSTVKTIGEAAFKNGTITNLYIGNAIESIGSEAFANNCIEYIELLTDHMIQIDETAFAGNTYETYIYLGWKASYDVFKEYEHLFLNIYDGSTYLYVQAPIKDLSLGLEYPADGSDSYNQDVWVSYNGTQPNLMTWYSWNRIPLTTLGDGLFKGNQTIRSWYPTHSFTVHHIGNEAFADSTVEIVDLYYGIETIGDAAFRNCVNIKEITLPETLTSIAANAFEGCTGLEKITILCDPSVIPQGLLDTCTALTEISAGPDASADQIQLLDFAINGKPEVTITTQPVDITVEQDYWAEVIVEAVGESLSYAWYVKGPMDADFALAEGFTGNSYYIPVTAENNGTQAYCVITDAYGSSIASNTAAFYIEVPAEEPTAVPVVSDGDAENFAGGWNAISGESDGMVLDKSMLEMFGMIITLNLNADGTGVLAMEGEEEGPVNWTYADGVITVSADGDSMILTVNADGTITGDLGGVILTFAKMDGEEDVPADELSEEEALLALLSMLAEAEETEVPAEEMPEEVSAAAPAASVEAFIGTWDGDGGTLTLNADGTGIYSVYSSGEEIEKSWVLTDVGIEFTDMWWYGSTCVLQADGTLSLDDGWQIFVRQDENAAAVTEPAVEEAPAEEMSDEELMALLAALAEVAETEEMEENAEVSAAPAEDGFVGTWHMVYLSSGGFTGDMRPMGVNYTLELRADGTGTVDYPEVTDGIWYEQDGFTYFGQGGDNADMPMALMDGGFLQYGSDLGGYLIMSQDPNAVYDPSMGTAQIAPGMDFTTEAPAAPAALTEIITDVNDRLERKFVVTSYTSMGQDFDASMLGTEYSVIFHENGTCDFTMAGMAMPNLPWGMQKVAVGLNEVDAFVINYYGMMFNAVLTDTGFDMDYYGTMNLHFVPAE